MQLTLVYPKQVILLYHLIISEKPILPLLELFFFMHAHLIGLPRCILTFSLILADQIFPEWLLSWWRDRGNKDSRYKIGSCLLELSQLTLHLSFIYIVFWVLQTGHMFGYRTIIGAGPFNKLHRNIVVSQIKLMKIWFYQQSW